MWIRPLALVIAGLAATAALAEDLDGRAIVDRADKQNRAKDEKDQISMTIVSPGGQKRKRELTSWFLGGEGHDAKILIRFDAPAEVKGTGLLTIEEGDRDDQWLYLPELKKTKRIAGATKSQSFMSTDFSNYDMRTEDLSLHNYEKKGEEAVDGRACWLVEATPKNDEAAETTGYARRTIYVDKERFTVPKGDYYDRNQKLLKVLTTDGWKQVEGLWRPAWISMENKQEGSKTVITFDRPREINKGLPDKLFSKRELERAD